MQVVIILEGGRVTEVLSDEGLTYLLIDQDIDGGTVPEDELISFGRGSNSFEAIAEESYVSARPHKVREYFSRFHKLQKLKER